MVMISPNVRHGTFRERSVLKAKFEGNQFELEAKNPNKNDQLRLQIQISNTIRHQHHFLFRELFAASFKIPMKYLDALHSGKRNIFESMFSFI